MAYEDDAYRMGRDVRQREMTPAVWHGGKPEPLPADDLEPDEEDAALEAWIAQRIESIHCRLLQRATAGRLTFDGDRIVPGPACARLAPVEPAAATRLSLPQAARPLREP